ncbi:stretch-activated Ca2+-permeable channel component-domain-containing protein [Peziza echinospora]|nr:stretch-activated Ca2+-permeable channel component-domain-containing protein [Peziza echinospora]
MPHGGPASSTGRVRRPQPAALLTVSFALLLVLLFFQPLQVYSSLHSHDGRHQHSSDPAQPPEIQDVDDPDASKTHHLVKHDHSGYTPLYDLTFGAPILLLDEQHAHGKRQVQPDVNALQNGVAELMNIEYGQLQHWWMDMNEVSKTPFGDSIDELKRRGGGESEILGKRQESGMSEIYLTFNTCFQPSFNQSLPLEQPLSQLTLYVSNTTANQTPGPKVFNRPQTIVQVQAGYASITVQASAGVWIGVYAPNLDKDSQKKYSGPWNYEIALSSKKPYHSWETKKTLYLIDSDNFSALLISGNMTSSENPTEEEVDSILSTPLPYQLYAQNTNYTSSLHGIERSFCALRPLVASMVGQVATSYTRRGLGSLPKQQFHITGLNKSSQYQIYLTKPDPTGSSSGVLWEPITITTKSDGNCQIIYDLPFCSEVAYAVPANPTVFDNAGALGAFYDNFARTWNSNFSFSLQQVQCNSSVDLTIQYSYERGCGDCAAAYKTWLCAVSIPRCADFSSQLPYLAERGTDTEFYNKTSNTTVRNSALVAEKLQRWTGNGSGGGGGNNNGSMAALRSRNPEIERTIRPGPYKEIKPCMDLCYSIVQSCPSQFGFTCPRERTWGKEVSYGERSRDGDVSCSWLGAAYFLSKAGRVGVGVGGMWGMLMFEVVGVCAVVVGVVYGIL